MTPPPSSLKLKLNEEKGVQQLHVLSELNDEDFKILKAGLTKLLKDGKNRIFVHFYAGTGLSPPWMEELKKLNSIARELAGEISLIATQAALLQNIKIQAPDQKVYGFQTAAEAFQFLKSKEPKSGEADLIQKLKSQLKDKEGGEGGKLKFENEALKKENRVLLDRLNKMSDERNIGIDHQGLLEKVQVLEKKLADALLAEFED